MKFSNGNWLNREGVNIYSPFEVNEVEKDDQSLTVYAPFMHIETRGHTLTGPLFTMKFSSPMQDVIRVQMYHFKGEQHQGPEFELFPDSNSLVSIYDNENEASLTSGDLTVKINKQEGWSVDFYNSMGRLTGSGSRGMGYVTTQDKKTYMREQLGLGVGESVYGLGERFTPFVKNGQSIDIWNQDGGTSTEQAYKNIPFYLTNRGYGVFVNHPENVSFEVGSEKVSKVQFSVSGEYLEYFIINGPSPKKVLENFTSLTGKPAVPPAWSFGLWLTTSFTTNYDEETVNHFVDGMIERDIPLHVFHFDCFWMKEYEWCNFEWDRRVFPDPEGMLRRLKEKGLKICVWINPYIAQKSKLFDEGKSKGYLLQKENGSVWQWDLWQPGMGIVDFTNPQACEWFASHLRRLIDMGVDCFKTDFGERIPTDVVYYDGSDPYKMHNYYSFLYNKVVFDVLEEKLGKGEAALFARSATVGGQQFPVHWGGDCDSTYEAMAESLRGGLSLGLSGFGFWSHDIGGFESTSSADLYKRWVAFGLLSSHSRLHGSRSYRVPWMYDEEAVDVLRFFTKLKCRLMPYLFSAACDASQKGYPMMRAMLLEFPDDPACENLDRQYMLGDSLLVAPIFQEGGQVSFYLPEGNWTHYMTGEKVEGGGWRKEEHGYQSLPLYVRANSLLAIGELDDRPDYEYAENVELHLFELQDGGSASTTVYDPKGMQKLTVEAKREGNEVYISANGTSSNWSVLLRGIQELNALEGGVAEATMSDIRLLPNPNVGELKIRL
ncbi:alpha-xylosidase [Metabacillus sp. FJAT-53654]|uniref:Alpha-xylosidase n=1 Tax=Metabacillus rhizosphaerae TaxID=3117747 RepID=A0ABZ2MVW8_9BACI